MFAGTDATGWVQQNLEDLVAGLEDLLDTEQGLLANVRHRLDFARRVKKETIDDHQEAWDEVIAWVANDDLYDGLELEPQLGLVPIGYDSRSGLWEFVHRFTGTVPTRRVDGQLILTEETGLVFVLIPGGSFDMGAAPPSDENPIGTPNVDPDTTFLEGPVHRVHVPPFFLSKYEMTQAQWLRATGSNPSFYEPGTYYANYSNAPITPLHPVESVSWKDCVRVLRQLDLRLPTEAEWEYAARSGTTTAWWTGDEKQSLDGAANLADLFFIGIPEAKGRAHEDWVDDGYVVPAPVGSFRPNLFGLHDVCGNVWEWCQDYWASYRNAPADGSAQPEPFDLALRVVRGGCWFDTAHICRSAHRFWRHPDYQSDFMGVRPARSVRHE
jgi:formylglycine-generating enzyme required for sulfatase activity